MSAPSRLASRWEGPLFALLMSLLMSVLMSGALSYLHGGMAGWLARWGQSFVLAWPLAFASVAMLLKPVRWCVRRLLAPSHAEP